MSYSQNYYHDAGEDSYSTSESCTWDYSPSSQGSTWPTSSTSRLDPRSPASYLSVPSPGGYTVSDAGTPDPDYGAEYSTQSHSQSSYYYGEEGCSPSTGSPNNEYPSSSKQATDQGHVCLVPNCTPKPFKRNADLDRHYKQRHRAEDKKDTYHCDYSKCSRKEGQPFHRKDHFRDHLREYHNEDLGKRGKRVSDEWIDNKHVRKDWWRCTRCLKRVMIKQHEFECPDCKTSCDQSRVKLRKSM